MLSFCGPFSLNSKFWQIIFLPPLHTSHNAVSGQFPDARLSGREQRKP
jgi:hypothetical protein